MKKDGNNIRRMLVENMKLFDMTEKENSPSWNRYVNHIDSIVAAGLLKTVGCR